jgi:hypothetical protein
LNCEPLFEVSLPPGRLLLRRVDSSPARIKTHHERPQIMLQ